MLFFFSFSFFFFISVHGPTNARIDPVEGANHFYMATWNYPSYEKRYLSSHLNISFYVPDAEGNIGTVVHLVILDVQIKNN